MLPSSPNSPSQPSSNPTRPLQGDHPPNPTSPTTSSPSRLPFRPKRRFQDNHPSTPSTAAVNTTLTFDQKIRAFRQDITKARANLAYTQNLWKTTVLDARAITRMTRKDGRKVYVCNNCGCNRSQFHGTKVIGKTGSPSFFTHFDEAGRPNRKIDPRSILMMIHLTAYENAACQVDNMFAQTWPIGNNAVVDWSNYIRELMTLELEAAPPMGGPGEVVQIDESHMQGKRKNNKGRTMTGNVAFGNGNKRNNYNNQVLGPWIFGIHHPVTKETRYFAVTDRSAATLIPIIQRHIAPGSTIHSDEWRAYMGINGLRGYNFTHETVNHSVQFVSATGVHTQGIERAWRRMKHALIKFGAGMRNTELWPGYCALFWWLSINGKHACDDPFLRIVGLINKHYPQ